MRSNKGLRIITVSRACACCRPKRQVWIWCAETVSDRRSDRPLRDRQICSDRQTLERSIHQKQVIQDVGATRDIVQNDSEGNLTAVSADRFGKKSDCSQCRKVRKKILLQSVQKGSEENLIAISAERFRAAIDFKTRTFDGTWAIVRKPAEPQTIDRG